MKRFNFSLQKVLDFREFEKKQAEAELGKAVAEETKIKDNLDTIARSYAENVRAADEAKDITGMLAAQNYFRFLNQQKEEALISLAQAQVVTEEKREKMQDAMKNCKVLENLRDKKIAAWKKENFRAEESEIDDIVTSKWN